MLEDVDMQPGEDYAFAGLAGPKDPATGKKPWAFPPGNYKCLGLAMNYRTRQKMVVYLGINGRDAGKAYLATLADWARNFTRLPTSAPQHQGTLQENGHASKSPQDSRDQQRRDDGQPTEST